MKTPPDIAKAMCEVGVKKAGLPVMKMFVLGILAGVYIGFGSQLATVVTQDLKTYVGIGFAQFLGGAVFSVGLMLVVIGGAELFTGNNLMITSCANKSIGLKGVMKNWGVVYVGNFVGSILLVVIVFLGFYYGANATSPLGLRAMGIANAKVDLEFISALARGIGCNWLVCMAVWLSVSADDVTGKIFACFFPIMAFVAIGFEHCVANMYFIPMGILLGMTDPYSPLASSNLNASGFIINNLIPVTIGNIIGGALFVGFIYWYTYLHTSAPKTAEVEPEQEADEQ